MEPFLDYYTILAVPFDASPEEITKAFRSGALKLHPDRNKSPDAHARFLELKQAYDILKDPQKRETYGKVYQLYMQGKAGKEEERSSLFEQANAKTGPEEQKTSGRPIYIILSLEKDQSVRVTLRTGSYALTAAQVNALRRSSTLRCQTAENQEALLMYCRHCHALFSSNQLRDRLGILYYPYELYPLCPNCDALNWCISDDLRDARQREEELQREQDAQARLRALKERNQREAREAAMRQEEARRKAALEQRRARRRSRWVAQWRIWRPIIALPLLFCVMLAILFVPGFIMRIGAPSITNITLERQEMTNGNVAVYISFQYSPGSQPGYLEIEFNWVGGVADHEELDTQNLLQGHQVVEFSTPDYSSSSQPDSFQVSWCPHYDCSQEQNIANSNFITAST